MDQLAFFAGIISPIMTLPQVIIIYAEKTVAGVSFASWLTYLFTSTFWLYYGIVHKEKPIMVMNGLWIFLIIIILAGIGLYG